MVITVISIYLTHHMYPVVKELFKYGEVFFVEEKPMSIDRKQAGFTRYNNLDFVIKSYLSKGELQRAKQAISHADLILTGGNLDNIVNRYAREDAVIFRMMESIFHGDYKDIIRKYKYRFIFDRARRHRYYHILAIGAFVCDDVLRCGKHINTDSIHVWGYFPDTLADIKLENRDSVDSLNLCWVGRLLQLKHPEVFINSISYIRDKYKCGISAYLVGNDAGNMKEELDNQARHCGVLDILNITGGVPTEKAQGYMRKSDLFFFTSNAQEGWGAVLNEAMGYGCTVIASDSAGATTSMIRDGYNGLIYRNGDLNDLYRCIDRVMSDTSLRQTLGYNAKETIDKLWNAECAVKNLMELYDCIKNGLDYCDKDGMVPCNKAIRHVRSKLCYD